MKRFKKIYIEITNVCNLSCNFCPKTKREYKFMDIESFEKVIKEVKVYTDYIYFHLMGEPLLNKNLESFLRIASDEGLKVNITTNGTLINEVKEVLLSSKSLRQVNISLHSFEANDSKIQFDQYLDNILRFIDEASNKTDIISSLRLWNMDTLELKANNKLNSEIINKIGNKFNVDFSIEDILNRNRGVKIKKNVYLNMAEKFQWPTMDINPINDKAFCYGLRDQIGVLVDGTVVPCCLDGEGNISLGNINEESLDEILKSTRAQEIYNGFSNRVAIEELCKRCGYVKRYNK